ncbi:MAG: aldo/keto reductase [Oscillospiraceae bacterium]|nr:aldo/keto reductase [Oscillospiraceae bacterium]
MQYRINPKNGDAISQLALGCMRFPRRGGKINQEKTNELVAMAIENGINYFDTAYIYPGSEEALGKALSACGKRREVKIATKLPHFMCRKPEDFDRIFSTQLTRLQTDYIDYYFIHMLGNTESWERLKSYGIEEWIEEKRTDGKIRNLGFSFHGGKSHFLQLLDVYDWDFCMVQYNYFDEHDQAGASGVRAAHERDLPVFVMEPLRGGLLADGLPKEAEALFRAADKNRSPAEWALLWLLNQPEVTMALSGMSNPEQLAENSRVADIALPNVLSESELSIYKSVVETLKRSIKVPCTACGYCVPCPVGVDIPSCFAAYNETYTSGLISGLGQYFQVTGMSAPVQSDASKCTGCKKCEEHCPQGIEIAKELVNVKRRMRIVKPIASVMRKFMRI